MFNWRKKGNVSFKFVASIVTIFFIGSVFLSDALRIKSTNAAVAQLPAPTEVLQITQAYSLPVLKGMRIDPMQPLKMEFIIDPGQVEKVDQESASKLIRHFLAALTIPEENVWVNLSPYEQDRIIPESLGVTEMGKELLEQDYILKQLSSSLTHPESKLGKNYWKDIYERLVEETGTTALPVNTFNKVWIMPAVADVYENKDHAIITDAKLKVMLEEDYLAQKTNSADASPESDLDKVNSVTSSVMKELVLPKIESEVNEGKHFATLRQIYHSQILATWFKKKFAESFYGAYINAQKLDGVDTVDLASKEKVFNLYVEAFKKGVYNYIKKEKDPATNKKVKRNYFSGGYTSTEIESVQKNVAPSAINAGELAVELIGMPKVAIDMAKSLDDNLVEFPQEQSQAASAIENGEEYAQYLLEAGTNASNEHLALVESLGEFPDTEKGKKYKADALSIAAGYIRTYEGLAQLARSGQIDRTQEIIIADMKAETEGKTKYNRVAVSENVVVMGSATNPPTVLHTGKPAEIALEQKAGTVITISQGIDFRKPTLLDKVPRYKMVLEIAKDKDEFFIPTGMNIDGNEGMDAETKTFALLRLNPTAKLNLLYVAGGDHYRFINFAGKEDTLWKIDRLNKEHAEWYYEQTGGTLGDRQKVTPLFIKRRPNVKNEKGEIVPGKFQKIVPKEGHNVYVAHELTEGLDLQNSGGIAATNTRKAFAKGGRAHTNEDRFDLIYTDKRIVDFVENNGFYLAIEGSSKYGKETVVDESINKHFDDVLTDLFSGELISARGIKDFKNLSRVERKRLHSEPLNFLMEKLNDLRNVDNELVDEEIDAHNELDAEIIEAIFYAVGLRVGAELIRTDGTPRLAIPNVDNYSKLFNVLFAEGAGTAIKQFVKSKQDVAENKLEILAHSTLDSSINVDINGMTIDEVKQKIGEFDVADFDTVVQLINGNPKLDINIIISDEIVNVLSNSELKGLQDLNVAHVLDYLRAPATYDDLKENFSEVSVAVPVAIEGVQEWKDKARRVLAWLAVRKGISSQAKESVLLKNYYGTSEGEIRINVLDALSDYQDLTDTERSYLADIVNGNDISVRVPTRAQIFDVTYLEDIVSRYSTQLMIASRAFYKENKIGTYKEFEKNLSVEDKLSFLQRVISGYTNKDVNKEVKSVRELLKRIDETGIDKSSSSAILTSDDLQNELDEMLAVTRVTTHKVNGQNRQFVKHVNRGKAHTNELRLLVDAAKAIEDAYLSDLSKFYSEEEALNLLLGKNWDRKVAEEMVGYIIANTDSYKLYTNQFNNRADKARGYEDAKLALKAPKRVDAVLNLSKAEAIAAIRRIPGKKSMEAEEIYEKLKAKVGASSAIEASVGSLFSLDKNISGTIQELKDEAGIASVTDEDFVDVFVKKSQETLLRKVEVEDDIITIKISPISSQQDSVLRPIGAAFGAAALRSKLERLIGKEGPIAVSPDLNQLKENDGPRLKTSNDLQEELDTMLAATHVSTGLVNGKKRDFVKHVNKGKSEAIELQLLVDASKAVEEAYLADLSKFYSKEEALNLLLSETWDIEVAEKIVEYIVANTDRFKLYATDFNKQPDLSRAYEDAKLALKAPKRVDAMVNLPKAEAIEAIRRIPGKKSMEAEEIYEKLLKKVGASSSMTPEVFNKVIEDFTLENINKLLPGIRNDGGEKFAVHGLGRMVNAYGGYLLGKSDLSADNTFEEAFALAEKEISTEQKKQWLYKTIPYVIKDRAELGHPEMDFKTPKEFAEKLYELGFGASSSMEAESFIKGGVDLSVSSALTVAEGSLPIDMPQYSLADIDGLTFVITQMGTVGEDIKVALAK